MTTGQKIKKLVNKYKVSPSELAEYLGYADRQSVYDIYKRKRISDKIIKSVIDYFNSKGIIVPYSYFFDDNIEIDVVKECVTPYCNYKIPDCRDQCPFYNDLLKEKERIQEEYHECKEMLKLVLKMKKD